MGCSLLILSSNQGLLRPVVLKAVADRCSLLNGFLCLRLRTLFRRCPSHLNLCISLLWRRPLFGLMGRCL